MKWRDFRLKIKVNNSNGKTFIPMTASLAEKIWLPGIYFPREKGGVQHEIIDKNVLVNLYSNGEVEFSQR